MSEATMTPPVDSAPMFTPDVSEAPAEAMCFGMGCFELGDNGEGAKSAPITMTARSGQPIDHWWWGRIVHDLSGMTLHKDRLAIDYCHDAFDVIGYLNKFDTQSGDLVASGALTPWKDSDRANEVIFKASEGVPYEASIFFGGDGIKLEWVDENMVTQVNGYEFEGPGVVVRQWPLRGVALCPHGADMNTESRLSGDTNKQFKFTVQRKDGTEMSKPNQPEEAPKAVETETTTELSTEAESNQTPAVEAETPETPETQLSDADDTTDPRAECKRFVAEFGAESGGEMYAEGLTFAQAQQKHSKKLSEENTALKARLDSIDRGEDDPAQLDDTGAELSEFDQKKQKFGKHLSNTPATLAACIKLPG